MVNLIFQEQKQNVIVFCFTPIFVFTQGTPYLCQVSGLMVVAGGGPFSQKVGN